MQSPQQRLEAELHAEAHARSVAWYTARSAAQFAIDAMDASADVDLDVAWWQGASAAVSARPMFERRERRSARAADLLAEQLRKRPNVTSFAHPTAAYCKIYRQLYEGSLEARIRDEFKAIGLEFNFVAGDPDKMTDTAKYAIVKTLRRVAKIYKPSSAGQTGAVSRIVIEKSDRE